MTTKPIPDGYHSVTPFLMVKEARALLTFLEQAFGAKTVRGITLHADGSIANAEIQLGDSMLMLAEARELTPTSAGLYLYVPDVDATYHQAVAVGGSSLMEPTTMFYGDRGAGIQDPSGNQWWIATHVEDVADDEVQRRHEQREQAQAAR